MKEPDSASTWKSIKNSNSFYVFL